MDEAKLVEIHERWKGSPAVRKAVLTAFMRAHSPTGLPYFLDAMEAEDFELRQFAYGALKSLFLATAPSFTPEGEPEVRAEQVASMRAWVADQRDVSGDEDSGGGG